MVVAGSGHSALTALAGLAGLAREGAGTRISWLLRRDGFGQVFGGGDADQLPARGALGARADQTVREGLVSAVFGFRTERVERAAGRSCAGRDPTVLTAGSWPARSRSRGHQ